MEEKEVKEVVSEEEPKMLDNEEFIEVVGDSEDVYNEKEEEVK